MFSRSGASTIAMNKVFKQKYNSINELVDDQKVGRKFKKQALAQDDDEFNQTHAN